MIGSRPVLGPIAAWGAVLCVLACTITVVVGGRSEARPPAVQQGAMRVVYVEAPAIAGPAEGPLVAAVPGRVQSLDWEDRVDGPAFALRIEEAARALAADGYSIVSVTPILRGEARTLERQGPATDFGVTGLSTIVGGFGIGWGAGYSVTDGVLMIAERR